MFGFGRSKGQGGILNARNGLMSVAALGLAYAGKKLWQKRQEKQATGLRESYSESSEWTPEGPTTSKTGQSEPAQSYR